MFAGDTPRFSPIACRTIRSPWYRRIALPRLAHYRPPYTPTTTPHRRPPPHHHCRYMRTDAGRAGGRRAGDRAFHRITHLAGHTRLRCYALGHEGGRIGGQTAKATFVTTFAYLLTTPSSFGRFPPLAGIRGKHTHITLYTPPAANVSLRYPQRALQRTTHAHLYAHYLHLRHFMAPAAIPAVLTHTPLTFHCAFRLPLPHLAHLVPTYTLATIALRRYCHGRVAPLTTHSYTSLPPRSAGSPGWPLVLAATRAFSAYASACILRA